MWTVWCGNYLTRWTLRFGLSLTFPCIIAVWPFPTIFTQCGKAVPGLHTTHCWKTNCQLYFNPFVFRGSCAWRDTIFTPCISCHLCKERGSRDVQYKYHGFQRIARVQSSVVYNYCRIFVQAWKIKHDSVVAQKTSLEHCNWASVTVVNDKDVLDATEAPEPPHLTSEAVAAQSPLL